MANELEGARSRRRYERATGPFNGVLGEDPVLIYDLNVGGGFINTPQKPTLGTVLALRISLSHEGSIDVNAEALYQHEHGVAVQFVNLEGDLAARIARTVDAFKRRF